MSNTPADRIVWIDCEMTGLDVERDGLCEIAVIVTDFELAPLDPGFEIVINPGPEALAHMNDFVRGMHEKSGLLPRIETGAALEEAERKVTDYVRRFVPKGRKPLVAGNTIGMDRRFISRYLPNFDAHLHYRSIDVSTIKELSRRWFPAAYHGSPAKLGDHRALTDIAESIRELDYFRRVALVQSPGPDAAAAASAAETSISRYAEIIGGE